MLNQFFLFSFFIKALFSISFDLFPRDMQRDITLDSYVTLFNKQHFNLPSIRLCFGTPSSQCFDLALSTDFQEIILEAHDSPMKKFHQQFNSSDSFTYSMSKFRRTMGFRLFGNQEYYLFGKEVQDFIHFPNMKYINRQLTFVLIESTEKTTLLNIDGFIGLSLPDADHKADQGFISFLHEGGFISQKTFALSYKRNGRGLVSFGENYTDYDYCNMTNPLTQPTKWKCKVSHLSIGKNNMTIRNSSIQFDSIKNAVIAPYEAGKYIFEYIIGLHLDSCYYIPHRNCLVLICKAKTRINLFPDIRLYMDKVELVIKWSNLFTLTPVNGTEVWLCSLLVNKMINEDYWLIGIPGFIDNRIVFEMENMKVRVIPLGKDQEEEVAITSNKTYLLVTLLVFLSVGVCYIIYVKYYCLINLIDI